MPLRRDPDGRFAVLDAPAIMATQVGSKRRTVRLAQTLERLGLPPAVREHPFHPLQRHRPLQLRMRFDLAWPEQRVALEIDGGVWTGGRHVRPGGFLGDHRKRNEAARYGWRIVYTTWQAAEESTSVLASILRDALAWSAGPFVS